MRSVVRKASGTRGQGGRDSGEGRVCAWRCWDSGPLRGCPGVLVQLPAPPQTPSPRVQDTHTFVLFRSPLSPCPQGPSPFTSPAPPAALCVSGLLHVTVTGAPPERSGPAPSPPRLSIPGEDSTPDSRKERKGSRVGPTPAWCISQVSGEKQNQQDMMRGGNGPWYRERVHAVTEGAEKFRICSGRAGDPGEPFLSESEGTQEGLVSAPA